ncbi:MAG: acetyltransferase [Geobacter sp.]|nr:MAG: acetyltransferase [Geobacter sp.]
MIHKFVTYIIRKKNPSFELDKRIAVSTLISLLAGRAICFCRSLRLLIFLKVPKLLFLGKGVKLDVVGNMTFGKWVQLHDYVYLSAMGQENLAIGNNVSIGAFSRLIISTSYNNPGKYIRIGNNVGLGEFAYLGGGGGLEIGDGCIIGQYLSCHPENHIYDDPDVEIRFQGTTRKGIKIGRNCWIGSKVTVLDAVTIGDGCVIAAGSVVTKDMPENSIIAGVPAKVIKSRVDSHVI